MTQIEKIPTETKMVSVSTPKNPATTENLRDILSYKKGVEFLATNNSTDIDYNSGAEHAMIVMENLINHAKEEINIFTGRFDGKVCNSYYEALKGFIISGGRINVLLNNINGDDVENNKILNLLRTFSSSDKYRLNIKVKVTTEKPKNESGKEIHFTVVDKKAFREEYDIANFSAKFSFNRDHISEKLNTIFFEIFNKSTSLNLSELTLS